MYVFKYKFVLEDLIQVLKKKSTALSFGSLQSNGHISVQGSFPAMKWLRDFLLLKAKISHFTHTEFQVSVNTKLSFHLFYTGGRYPPKYPMIHDSGFLVLLIFRGFPAIS